LNKLIFILSFLFVSIKAIAGDYSITAGAEYTNGDYGGEIDTSIFYAPFTLEYKAERYSWGVTVPFVYISGSEDVVISSTTKTSMTTTKKTSTTSSTDRTDSGIGDIQLTGTYHLTKETADSPWLGVTGTIKLGTADEDKNLGTGETDYSLQLDAGKKALHGYIGYRIIGDSDTVDYDNTFFMSAGVTLPGNNEWMTTIDYYFEEASVSGGDDAQDLTLTWGKKLEQRKFMSVYFIKGLSDASPDLGVGITLTYGL
jgi:hypothetical protein